MEPSGIAITSLSSCLYLYTLWDTVAMMYCTAVMVKMPNLFTNEQHADIHFTYGLCNQNDRAVVVEYRQWYPLCKTQHHKIFGNAHRTLRETSYFPQATAEHEQWHGENDVLAVVQRSASTRADILFMDDSQCTKAVIMNIRHSRSREQKNPYKVVEFNFHFSQHIVRSIRQ